MNWQKIAKKYPTANARFNEWREEIQNDDFYDFTFKTRDLFDFFDSYKIKLFVSLADNFNEFQQGNTLPQRRFIIWADKTFESRVNAEYAAFEKGFELLEKQLRIQIKYKN